MIKDKVFGKLSEQVVNEFSNAFMYMQAASIAKKLGWLGAENWLTKQYQEELGHAEKIINFINDNNREIALVPTESMSTAIKDKSLLGIFTAALDREKLTTGQIYTIRDLAFKNDCQATEVFMNWFVEEQVSEEDQVQDLVSVLSLAKDNAAALLAIDKELGSR